MKPQLGEVASDYQAGLTAFTGGLLANPDPILREKGGSSLQLYEELLRDDQVGPCFEQRRRAVVQSEWIVDPATSAPEDKRIADFVRDNLAEIDFDGITEKMLFGLLYGYGVAEIIWQQDGSTVKVADIKVRKASRFRFDQERRLRLITLTKPTGEIMPDRKFWTFSVGSDTSDNPYGRGLGYALYWPAFFKRNGVKFWMIFLDKFAMPTTAAKVNPGVLDNPKELRKVLEMLGAIQTDSAVVVPDNVAIELIEAARSGTVDYDTLVERMDKAIAKIILSQTMTTENGSSLAQAEVHKEVRDEVVKADADLICASLNHTVVRWLVEYNFPGTTRFPRVWRKTEPAEDLTQMAERDNKIAALGYEPTEEYIAATYGPGWRKRERPLLPPALGQLPAEFTEVSPVAAERVAHRADQQHIADAAQYLSTKYRELYGNRVETLLSYLEETDDIETFKARLADLMSEPPSEQAVAAVRNASFVSRLMGLMRGQRHG